MWLTDLLLAQRGMCPTCPTSKKVVGHAKSLTAVDVPTVSDMSDIKTAMETPPEGKEANQSIFTQVSYKNPECVRHFPLEDDPAPAARNRFESYWRSVCPDYWRGCLACPDADLVHTSGPMAGHLNGNFCRRHAPPPWARTNEQGRLLQ